MATLLKTKWLADLAVTSAKIDSTAVTTGKIADLAVTTAKIDSTAVTTDKIALLAVHTEQLDTTAVSAAKLGNIAGNGLSGGIGFNLTVAADGTTIAVGASGIKVKEGSIDATHLSGGIPDSKLLQITTTNKVAGSAVEDVFLRNDSDDTSTGRIKANGFDANNQQIKSVADGTSAFDAVNYQQLQSAVGTLTLDGTSLIQTINGLKVNAGGIDAAHLASGSVTAAKLAADTKGNGIVSGAGTAITVLADGTSLTVGASGVKVTAAGIDEAMLANGAVTSSKIGATAVTAAKLGSDVAGNGLTGGNGTALAALADGTSLTVGGTGIKITNAGVDPAHLSDAVAGAGLSGGAGSPLSVNVDSSSIAISGDTLTIPALGITNGLLAGSISDDKLSTITTANKVSGSAVQDVFLRNDSDDTSTGRIQANGFDANNYRISRVADATANSDAVNYGQMQTAINTGMVWKETILYGGQLKDGTTNIGGIRAANVLTLSANFVSGDTITLNDGTTVENYVADTDFVIGGTINASLTNLAAVIEAAPIAASTTTGLLSSIDASNNVMLVWQDVLGSPIRIYGNAAAATRASILPVSKLYNGEDFDLVPLPTADPATTNFGFSRNHATIVAGETHYVRESDTIYTWDHDANVWNLSGASSIPFASKVVYGKVLISDGIAVSSGIISVQADSTSLTVGATGVKITDSGVTTGKIADSAVITSKINNLAVTTDKLDATSVTAAKLAADTKGNGIVSGAGTAITVLADGTSLTVSGTGVKITDLGVTTGKIADLAVTTAKLDASSVTFAQLGAVTGNGLTGGNGAVISVLADGTTIGVSGSGIKLADSAVTAGKIATGAVGYDKLYLDSTSGITSDGTNRIKVQVKVGGGLTLDSNGLSIDPTTINAYKMEQHTLSGGEITAKAFQLTAVPSDSSQVSLTVLGGVLQTYAVDYSVTDTTVGWTGLGLDGWVLAGETVQLSYPV